MSLVKPKSVDVSRAVIQSSLRDCCSIKYPIVECLSYFHLHWGPRHPNHICVALLPFLVFHLIVLLALLIVKTLTIDQAASLLVTIQNNFTRFSDTNLYALDSPRITEEILLSSFSDVAVLNHSLDSLSSVLARPK